jgi:hypothetical protein
MLILLGVHVSSALTAAAEAADKLSCCPAVGQGNKRTWCLMLMLVGGDVFSALKAAAGAADKVSGCVKVQGTSVVRRN